MVGPVKNSDFVVSSVGANVTGGGSHGDAFVQQMVRFFVGK